MKTFKSNLKPNTTQTGIALVQVLIISLILSSLAIFISQAVKSQVNTVRQMQQAFELRLKLESVEAQLLQTLLTEQPYVNVNSFNPLVTKWNFYGKKFAIDDNTNVAIQDLSSLINLNIIDRRLMLSMLFKLGVDESESYIFLDSLLDWVDADDFKRINGAESQYYKSQNVPGPRNGYIQSMAEVNFVKGAHILSDEQWSKYFSTELVSGFNPLNAPTQILSAFIKADNIVNQVIELRENNQLNMLKFYQLTGIEDDEFITFATGSRFLVKITVERGNQRVSKQFTVALNPRSVLRPIIITDVAWNVE